MTDAIPPWCKPKGWAIHLPNRVVFQAERLQRDKLTGAYYLRDCNEVDYPLEECRELTQRHLQQPAIFAFEGDEAALMPHPKGVVAQYRSSRLLLCIPDAGEQAARALADFFNGAVYSEEVE